MMSSSPTNTETLTIQKPLEPSSQKQ
jgi:hypothetical protein